MNARKSIYNILSGLLGQGIAILLGIMIPRLVIVNLGSESNGLLSSVNQMLIYLNLLESGVGTAALQSLYRPVAEKFRNSGVGVVLSVTPCWCYGFETIDMDGEMPKAIWGFNGTERPGAVYLASALASHTQKVQHRLHYYGIFQPPWQLQPLHQ